MSKINSVTIVCQQGTKSYSLGQEVNKMVITEIEDKSIEMVNGFHSIYVGYDKDKNRVFETYNAPADVDYVLEDGD